MKLRFALILVLFGPIACGDDPAPLDASPRIQVISQTPEAATWASDVTVNGAADIEALGRSAADQPVAIVGKQVFAVERGSLSARLIYDESAEVTDVATVHAIFPRQAGGAWIGSSAGLFIMDASYTLPSPFRPDGDAVLTIAEPDRGPLAGLWLGTPAGLFSRTADGMFQYDFEGRPGAVTQVAINRDGQFGLLVQDGRLYTLEADGADLWSADAPFEGLTVSGLAGGSSAVWAATDRGVLRFDLDGWTHYPLAESTPIAARAIAVDPATEAVWARVDGGVVKMDGDALELRPVSNPSGMHAIAVDGLGDVYTPSADGLKQLGDGGGDAVRFQTDVVMWLEARCTQCHADFTDYGAFAARADNALARVRSGDMPRCNGGVLCAPEQQLAPADYAVLEQWIRDGLPE